jgi:hypothetical protein
MQLQGLREELRIRDEERYAKAAGGESKKEK